MPDLNEPLPASQLQTTPGGYPLVPSRIVVPGDHGLKMVREIVVEASPLQAYAFWKDWARVANVLPVTWQTKVLTPVETLLVITAPGCGAVTWTHSIINDEKAELLAFRSNEQAPMPYAGTLRFEGTSEGHCHVRLQLDVLREDGAERIVDANAFEEALDEGLLRFKRAIEGDLATKQTRDAS